MRLASAYRKLILPGYRSDDEGRSSMLKYHHRKDRYGLSTPVLAILATFVIAVVVTCLSLMRTAGEANMADSDRTRRGVMNAIDAHVATLAGLAEDNAYGDATARALHLSAHNAPFAMESWARSTSIASNYDCVFAVNSDGRILFMITDGQLRADRQNSLASPQVRALMGTLAAGRSHDGALMRGSDGPRIAGIARVRAQDPQLQRHLADHPPVYLVMSRRLSSGILAQISRDLVVENLHLHQRPVQTEDLVALNNVMGEAVGFLTWRPAMPGYQALNRSMPFFLLALIAGALAISLLITRTMAAMQDLNRIALIDSLSGLPNRRALRHAMKLAERAGQPMAIAFIDLDGFKGVNDSFGHAVGDELIRQCAAIASDVRPDEGMVARLGGDEFAILAIGDAADDAVCISADALLQALKATFRIGERRISIGASIGIASSTLDAAGVSELMRQADIAMYAAKRSGKMRRLWFTPEMDRSQATARAIELRLKDALDAGEFDVHYQPIIDARTGKVTGIEGLLRWDQNGDAAIGPDQFIPIAEESGLIDRLGQFVLRQGCEAALAWGDVRLCVNVSSAQLRNPEFPGQLKALLEEIGFPADRLELEVTETYVVVDPVMAGKVLSGIRALGVRLALDDFGTGYASIGFLRQFAFDTLKIDKSLISTAIHEPGARAMLNASIAVARALNMVTVAEGIEDEAQAVFVRAAGCDFLQGWLFSKAVDAATMGDVLALDREGPGPDGEKPVDSAMDAAFGVRVSA